MYVYCLDQCFVGRLCMLLHTTNILLSVSDCIVIAKYDFAVSQMYGLDKIWQLTDLLHRHITD